MTGRAERSDRALRGRQTSGEREIKNQGEATAHPGRPSKAPNWSWNANPFYFPLKLMEITSLFPNFYNNKTAFYKDRLKELPLWFVFFSKKPILDYFPLIKVQSRKLKKLFQMDTEQGNFFHWNTDMSREAGKMAARPNTISAFLYALLLCLKIDAFLGKKKRHHLLLYLCGIRSAKTIQESKAEGKKMNVSQI